MPKCLLNDTGRYLMPFSCKKGIGERLIQNRETVNYKCLRSYILNVMYCQYVYIIILFICKRKIKT